MLRRRLRRVLLPEVLLLRLLLLRCPGGLLLSLQGEVLLPRCFQRVQLLLAFRLDVRLHQQVHLAAQGDELVWNHEKTLVIIKADHDRTDKRDNQGTITMSRRLEAASARAEATSFCTDNLAARPSFT